MIYLVLGYHKSGTTLVSQMLHRSGINMVEHESSASYAQGNQYELEQARDINNALLDCAGMLSFEISPDTRLRESPELDAEIVQLIQRRSAAHRDWGMKDPRLLLTYDVWRRHLPPHRIIFIYRDYRHVLSHYKARGKVSMNGSLKADSDFWRVLQTWQAYNERFIQDVRSTNQNHVILNYHALMTEAVEMDRLSEFVGQPLVDTRDPSLYHPKNFHIYLPIRLLLSVMPSSPFWMYQQLNTLRHQQLNSGWRRAYQQA